MNRITLGFVSDLNHWIKSPSPDSHIQVVLGPRQVGKTTGVTQFLETLSEKDTHYASADGEIPKSTQWIYEQWTTALAKSKKCLIVLDEIQKVDQWSEAVKKLWDKKKRLKEEWKLLVLGSSSLAIQKGLSESLTGRFQLRRVFHWSYQESREAFGMSWEDYLRFGGYPGSYPFSNDVVEWTHYLNTSIIDTVIGKDILQQARIKSPALFRQCFEIACAYPAQEVSYTKLLGQLQDKGNTDQIKFYLEQLEGAFLLKQLFKFSNKKVLTKSSSPKLLPLCPALFSVGMDADLDAKDKGRCFELIVGAALIRLPGRLYYWRDRQHEVDFVHQFGKKLTAIEVKSGRVKSTKGLAAFQKRFKTAKSLVLTPENFETAIRTLAT